jgi:hypothetical protein
MYEEGANSYSGNSRPGFSTARLRQAIDNIYHQYRRDDNGGKNHGCIYIDNYKNRRKTQVPRYIEHDTG